MDKHIHSQRCNSVDNSKPNYINMGIDCDYLPFTNNHIEIVKDPILITCTKGEMELVIDNIPFRICNENVLLIFPFQQLSVTYKTIDFRCMFLQYSNYFHETIMVDIPYFFLIYYQQNMIYKLNKSLIEQLKLYFTIIESKIKKNNLYTNQIINHMLHIIFYDLFNFSHPQNSIEYKSNKIAYDFFNLLKDHLHESKSVSFYAKKLCITPKHLNRVIKDNMKSKSAKEWIDFIIIIEIKKSLKDKKVRIKEIAEYYGFSSQFLFFQYFKKNTGLSPNEYRKLIDK